MNDRVAIQLEMPADLESFTLSSGVTSGLRNDSENRIAKACSLSGNHWKRGDWPARQTRDPY